MNLEVIRQGYGQAYTSNPFQHVELFMNYEIRAKRLGKGLWLQKIQEEEKGDKDDIIVYITRTGKKYHTEECRWGYIEVELKEAKNRGLAPCKVCNPPQ